MVIRGFDAETLTNPELALAELRLSPRCSVLSSLRTADLQICTPIDPPFCSKINHIMSILPEVDSSSFLLELLL